DFLRNNAEYAVVCGNVCEQYPEASIYNGLMNMELQGLAGDGVPCGGIAIYRIAVFASVGLFNENMIAGEEGDLCLRMLRSGYKLMKLDIPMANHDADMRRFVQWWCRSVRCGHAYAHGYDLHWKHSEGYKKHQVVSAMAYGFCFPLLFLALLSIFLTQSLAQLPVVFTFTAILFVLSLYIRLIEKCVKSRLMLGNSLSQAWLYGTFVALGKLPEAQGIIKYYLNKIRGVTAKIIEYRAN
ncbi:hypothetical protein OAE19_07985, partial [Porticoccaceae bacterium]|nr:hypothetical protein [Porticoccaceae bacterium]